ncbi:MAG: hypothetical protein U0Q16_25740 [Bryobacteraceae bacterium]
MDDDLLRILGDGDPAKAEERYEYLFRYFCRYFEWRGCDDPEDLAQTVFLRGIEKLRGGSTIWADGIGGFLYGFARKILQETRKARKPIPIEDLERMGRFPPRADSAELAVLIREYLAMLDRSDRQALLDYVNGRRSGPGESPQALRIKIFRIRKKLNMSAKREKKAGAG